MKRTMAYILYAISSVLDDIAFYVLLDEEEETGIIIETHWCQHYF